MSLPALRQAVKSAATEQGEVAAVTRHLRDQHGFSKPYAVNTQQGADRRVVRIYVWRNTPMGHVALVAGPSLTGQAHVVEEVEGTVTPADVDLFIPASGRSPALAAYKRGAAPVRGNSHGRDVTRAMVGETTWGGGYSPHSYRPNPRELSPGFSAQIAESRRRSTGGPSGPVGPSGPTGGSARAPVFAWLYDAAGRRYRVQYRVIATQTDGRGPVLASNLPGSFTDTPAYPPAFQARSLSRMGEQQKIQRIAADMDPARYLLPHADPTFGAPVVWEGNGEAGTRPGVYYVLGGNSRTIAFLMASDAKIREYDAAAAELWPDIWPDEPAPRGYRYLVVRQAYPPSCPSLADARALNAACQMAFAQAQGLAGATQQSMAGRETPLGEAVSLVRGLGITGDIAEIVPSFNWSRGAVARDNVADFIADLDNRHFLDSLRDRLGAERFNGFVSDPDNAAKLINSVLIGFLPRGILDRGFGTEKEEQALLAALPAMVTLRIAERQGKIPAGFDLLPHLEDARAFADGIKGMTVAQARSSIEAMRAQGSLNLRTRDGDIVRSLGDRIGPLGILLGLTIKRAEAARDPSIPMDAVLIPYVAAALASPDRFKVAGDNAMFAAFAKPTMPKSYPVEVLGGALARAISGPEAEPIIPQTRASDRGETGGGAVVSVGSPSGGLFGSRPAAPAAPAPVEPPPLAAPARPAMFAAPAPAAGPKLNGDALVDILMDGGRNSVDPGYDDFEGVVDQLRRAGMDRQAAEDLAYAGSQAWRKNMSSPHGAEDVIRVAVAGVVPGFGGGASRGAAAPASVGLFGGRAAPVEPAPLAAPAVRGPVALPQSIINELLTIGDRSRLKGYSGLKERNDSDTRAAARMEIDALAAALNKGRGLIGPEGLIESSQQLIDDTAKLLREMTARVDDADDKAAAVDKMTGPFNNFRNVIQGTFFPYLSEKSIREKRPERAEIAEKRAALASDLRQMYELKRADVNRAVRAAMYDGAAYPKGYNTAAVTSLFDDTAALIDSTAQQATATWDAAMAGRLHAPAPAPAPAPTLDLADELLRQAGLGPAAAPAGAAVAPPYPLWITERGPDTLALWRRLWDLYHEAKQERVTVPYESAQWIEKYGPEGHAAVASEQRLRDAVADLEGRLAFKRETQAMFAKPKEAAAPVARVEPKVSLRWPAVSAPAGAPQASVDDLNRARNALIEHGPSEISRLTPPDVLAAVDSGFGLASPVRIYLEDNRDILRDQLPALLDVLNARDQEQNALQRPPAGETEESLRRALAEVTPDAVLGKIPEKGRGVGLTAEAVADEVAQSFGLLNRRDGPPGFLAHVYRIMGRLQRDGQIKAGSMGDGPMRFQRLVSAPPPPPVAAPAPAAPLSKEDRMAALLRDKVSRANPYARRNPLAPWEHDARPIYRPLLSAPYRRNGGPVLDERVKGAIRQILAAKYGKTGDEGEAVLATLLGAVAQLDATTPTDKLATVILGALADIVAIFDEDEGGEAVAPAAPRAAAPVEPAPLPGGGGGGGGGEGDVRRSLGGRDLTDYAQMVDLLRALRAGDRVTIGYRDTQKGGATSTDRRVSKSWADIKWATPSVSDDVRVYLEPKVAGSLKFGMIRDYGARDGLQWQPTSAQQVTRVTALRLEDATAAGAYSPPPAAWAAAPKASDWRVQASGISAEGLGKSIAEFYGGEPKQLIPVGPDLWAVSGARGIIDTVRVAKRRGRAYFESIIPAAAPRVVGSPQAVPVAVEPAPLAAPAVAPTVAALGNVPHLVLAPDSRTGGYSAQVMSQGSPLSTEQSGTDGFDRVLSVLGAGSQYARHGGRNDYALVNTGREFVVMPMDDARAFLARQAAVPAPAPAPAPTRTAADLPPEALEQIRAAMRDILAGLPA